MWNTLAWRPLRDPEIAAEVEGLRADTLRMLCWIGTAGYLAWHTLNSIPAPAEEVPRYWTLFPVVALGLGGTYLLQRTHPVLATSYFLVSSLVSAMGAMALFEASFPTLLLPLIALAAIVLLHPLAGLALAAGSVAAVGLLWWLGPLGFLGTERVLELAVASLLAVVAGWALGRNMVTAVEWSLDSYAQALRNTQAAQRHRAELVQALKQLDHAYYRLERANAALELAWKAAEAAERAKTEFVTNISHELRTPLNLIVGFSEMIVTSPASYGEPLPSAYRGDLNAIYRSAQHLLTLSEDVLDLARVGMGRLALAREPVDLEQIVEDACAIVREYVATKGLFLRIEVAPDVPVLSVDRLRIRQVLLNLLTNAARFTDRGGISVSAAKQDGWVVVRVTDTGRGMTAEQMKKAFEEFHHDEAQDGSYRGRLTGVGLGLPLSKRFVELHGGEMGVEAVSGVGTTFWFSLPSAPVDGTVQEDAWRPIRSVGLRGAAERVLVLAGCDGRLAHFLQRHLRGCQVAATPTLARAATIATEFRALAILADIDEGLAVDPPRLPVPLIRLPLPHNDRISSALGTVACLVKPVTRSELRAAIARLARPVRTILIADDDPRFVRLMTRFLQGYEIQGAPDGRAALALMAESPPDLLLLDLMMPEMDGTEVLGAMAARPELAQIPVIVVSARDRAGGQLSLPGALSVEKPDGFRLEELLGVVEALLGQLDPPRQYLTSHPDRPRRSRTPQPRAPSAAMS